MNEDLGFVAAVAQTRQMLLEKIETTELESTCIFTPIGVAIDETDSFFFKWNILLGGHSLRATGVITSTPVGCEISGSLFLAEWVEKFVQFDKATDQMVEFLSTAALFVPFLYLIIGREDAFESSLTPGLVGCYSPEFWSLICKRWDDRTTRAKIERSEGHILLWPQSISDFWHGKASNGFEQCSLGALGRATGPSIAGPG